MRYGIVLFDADGTLLDFKKSEREAIREARLSVGIFADDEMIATYSRINDGLWKMLERGEIEKSVLLVRRFEDFFTYYGLDADAPDLAKRYMQALSEKAYLLDGAGELCRKLYGKCRLYIVTNGVEFIQRGRWARTELNDYFEDSFISGVIGYEKPDVRYFEAVAEKIPDFQKEKTVIVGDSLTSDMQGGFNFGIDTCYYNPEGRTIPEETGKKLTFVAKDFCEIYNFLTEDER